MNDTIVLAKRALRREIKERTATMTKEEMQQASAKITEQLLELPAYKEAKVIFCFVGMDGEPDTAPFMEQAFADGKIVGVPKCIARGVMEVRRIHSFLDMTATGSYGIPEPGLGTELMHPEDFDFAVVPCVSCDRRGSRMGHGMGYYDRYLENMRATTCTILFDKLVSDEIPMEAHDKRLDMVLTEKGLWKTEEKED